MYCKLSIHEMIRQRKRERTGERDPMTIRYHIILGRAQGFLEKQAQRTDRTVARCHGAVFRVVVGSVPIRSATTSYHCYRRHTHCCCHCHHPGIKGTIYA